MCTGMLRATEAEIDGAVGRIRPVAIRGANVAGTLA
jgi:hypothetical protein